MNIPNWLETASHNHPDKIALQFGVERWAFSELQQQVAAAARMLAARLPVEHGRIGILSANRPGFVVAVHAAMQLVIPFVPLNWRLTAAELTWQIEDAGVTLLITDELHQKLSEHLSSERGIAVVPIAALETPVVDPHSSPTELRGMRMKAVNLHHEAAVMYTSGTSGRPKGAVLTYGNFWFSAAASALHIGHHADDIWLLTLPLFHIGGLSVLTRGVIGATPVILHDRFDPHRALAAIDEGATLISLTPTMLDRTLALRGDHPWPEPPRCILLGGSAAPTGLVEDAIRRGIPIAPTYGLTEATSQVTTLLPEQARLHRGSSGRPLPLTRIRIMTAHGEAPAEEIGDIEILGPTVFNRYLGDEQPRDPECWFATGDVGYLDTDGFLLVVDRRDDLIVSGGENIYPAEIERVLRAHPLVSDAGVVGAQHETWGARPVAAVVWTGDPQDADRALRDHCAQDLASYKIPDRFILAAELPRTPSGKLLRRVLTERISSAQSSSAATSLD